MSARRLLAVASTLLAFGLACSSGGPAPTGTPAEEPAPAPATSAPAGDLSLARAALLGDPDNCFLGRSAYCIDDPAFVDPILREVIERSFHGEVPTTMDEGETVARRARGRYRNAQLDSPEARAQVEAAVRANFEDPPVTREQGLVRADLGVVPGALTRTGRAGWDITSSEQVANGELLGTVAAAKLDALRQAEPDATTVALDVLIPANAGSYTRFEYRYAGNRDRILVRRQDRSNQTWFTPKLGGDLGPYVRGERGLLTSELETCTLKQAIWGVDPDCPR